VSYDHWCVTNGCTHGHCPDGCEHPQPVELEDGRLVCGRCLCLACEVRELLPCLPSLCE
jgi:hypothetical protein